MAFWKWGHTYKKSVSIPKKNQANMERTWELDVVRRVFLPGEMLFALQSGVLEDLDRTELHSLNMIEELSC